MSVCMCVYSFEAINSSERAVLTRETFLHGGSACMYQDARARATLERGQEMRERESDATNVRGKPWFMVSISKGNSADPTHQSLPTTAYLIKVH